MDAGKMPLCPHLLQLVIITYTYYLLCIGTVFERWLLLLYNVIIRTSLWTYALSIKFSISFSNLQRQFQLQMLKLWKSNIWPNIVYFVQCADKWALNSVIIRRCQPNCHDDAPTHPSFVSSCSYLNTSWYYNVLYRHKVTYASDSDSDNTLDPPLLQKAYSKTVEQSAEPLLPMLLPAPTSLCNLQTVNSEQSMMSDSHQSQPPLSAIHSATLGSCLSSAMQSLLPDIQQPVGSDQESVMSDFQQPVDAMQAGMSNTSCLNNCHQSLAPRLRQPLGSMQSVTPGIQQSPGNNPEAVIPHSRQFF